MTENEEEVEIPVPELPPMADTDASLAENNSGNQPKKRRIDVKALAAAAMAENNARKRQRAAAAKSSGADAEKMAEKNVRKRQRAAAVKSPGVDAEEEVSGTAAMAEGGPAVAMAEGDPQNESESDNTGLYGATPEPEWLKSFFAFHLFRSRNGPNTNPSTKSEDNEEKRLATWVKSNRKLLSKVNDGTATNMMKVKVEALQQVSAYQYYFV